MLPKGKNVFDFSYLKYEIECLFRFSELNLDLPSIISKKINIGRNWKKIALQIKINNCNNNKKYFSVQNPEFYCVYIAVALKLWKKTRNKELSIHRVFQLFFSFSKNLLILINFETFFFVMFVRRYMSRERKGFSLLFFVSCYFFSSHDDEKKFN